MGDKQRCHNCGRPLFPEQLICKCGAKVGEKISEQSQMPELIPSKPDLLQLPKEALPNIDLGKLEDSFIDLTSLEHRETTVNKMKIVPSELELLFATTHANRGSPYRPLLVVGRQESAKEKRDILVAPFGVFQFQDGPFYVIDFLDETGRARIQSFDKQGNFLRTIRRFEVGSDRESLDTPVGLAVDVHKNIYIIDMGGSCIKKFSSRGDLLLVYGNEGIGKKQLMTPHDLDLDPEGNLYIADTDNNRILKWNQQGSCLMALGASEVDEDTGWLMAGEESGELDGPKGVKVDAEGNIWVADTNNHRVQKFNSEGEYLQTFGEEGEGIGQFYYPDGIDMDANGDVYVSDMNSERIQKFNVDGNGLYQIYLPGGSGTIRDFVVDDEGYILVALRQSGLVVRLEVIE